MEEVLRRQELASVLHDKLVISIAAGVSLLQLEHWMPSIPVIRAMPNTPCRIGKGMVVISTSSCLLPEYRAMALRLLQPLGPCRILDDQLMDAATALSGSGPAFAWYAHVSRVGRNTRLVSSWRPWLMGV